MATNYIELNLVSLLDFANGSVVDTFSVPTSSLGPPLTDAGTALTYLAAHGWTLVNAYGYAVILYLLTNTDAAAITYKLGPMTGAGPYSFLGTKLIGFKNNSSSAQTGLTATVYDNPTTAAGTIIETLGALNIGQVVTYPPPGLTLASGGFTVSLSGAPGANGIQALYL